jgi:hypothetical protein
MVDAILADVTVPLNAAAGTLAAVIFVAVIVFAAMSAGNIVALTIASASIFLKLEYVAISYP